MPDVMTNDRMEALRQYNAAELPTVEKDTAAEDRARERLFDAPAELYQAPAVYVCSVWPRRVESEPFSHGGIGAKRYVLEPGSPKKPFVLAIRNTYTLVMTIGSLSPSGDFMSAQEPKPVYAAQIAKDVIQRETGNHPGNVRGKKGIGIIAGPVPTPAEIEYLANLQTEFLKYIVERADEFYDSGKREKIGGEHREALKMLALDELQHPWYRSKMQMYNSCPACAERILVEARVCKVCHSDLVKFFTDAGELPSKDQWPNVFKAMDKATAKGAPHAK